MRSVLIVDDAPDIRETVRGVLQQDFSLFFAGSIAEARSRLNNGGISLVLLDAGLPDGDGFSFCQELKANPNTKNLPVLMLTGRADIQDRLMGFAMGAEDYIIKPFHPLELRARVMSRLNRELVHESDNIFTCNDLRFCISSQRVYMRSALGTEEEIILSALDFRLLLHFARNIDKVFSRERLIDAIWGAGIFILDRTVDSHISHLRKKINNGALTIESVHGVGYRLALKKSYVEAHVSTPIASRSGKKLLTEKPCSFTENPIGQ